MSTTLTPRTDKNEFRAIDTDSDTVCVASWFARQLERELQQATAERQTLDAVLSHAKEEVKQFCLFNFGYNPEKGDEPWMQYVSSRVDKLRADLARVTAELAEERKCEESTYQRGQRDIAALRARVAELVEQLKAYGKYAHDTTLDDQNAELLAALREMVSAQDATVEQFTETEIVRLEKAMRQSRVILAHAESATPAKHPDTDGDCGCDEPLGATFARAELRAIDAAMKGGAQ